jgi:hypothetical protein
LDAHPEYKETIVSQFSDGRIKIENFILFCSNHLILLTIYLHFKKHRLLDIFPDDLNDHLNDIYELIKDFNPAWKDLYTGLR